MKKGDKYAWRIGSAPPLIEQHSVVKHRIIESYVREYILTLMSQATIPKLQLTLVDGFSGGGAYLAEDGAGVVDGSPVLMMRAVREARARLNIGRDKPREVAVDYAFIDVERDTAAYLEQRLAQRADEGAIERADLARARVCQGDFLAELPRLVGEVKARRMGEHAIFVLDQYSYDKLPMADLAGLMRAMQGAEVLLTFNVGSLITFLADRAANRLPMERIGLAKHVPWESLRALKQDRQWRQVLQRHLAYGIRQEAGARFATLFFVRPLGATPWDYWLIHLSNRYKAHEVMKNLHWDNATAFGHELEPGVFMQGYDANRDHEYTGQETFDFGDTSREACVNGIHEHFGRVIFEQPGPVRLRDLVERYAAQSPGSTQHFIQAAGNLHRSQDVIICSPDGRTLRPSKSYHLNSTIEAARTPRLIP
ncbi:MAG: three-Cys-motif partner protein TcmP [Proteobacteria bacterium]|nr:three-Cys-motif partner protein TcmP [Pseudomonadota bacterium]